MRTALRTNHFEKLSLGIMAAACHWAGTKGAAAVVQRLLDFSSGVRPSVRIGSVII